MSYVSRNPQSVHMYMQRAFHCHAYLHRGVCSKMAASQGFLSTYKGKEYLLVEETKKKLEALQCPVCFEIVLELVQTSSSSPLFSKRWVHTG